MTDINRITCESERQAAIAEIESLRDAPVTTREGRRRDFLEMLLEEYEKPGRPRHGRGPLD